MLLYQPANSKLDYPAPQEVRLVCDTSTLGIVVPLGFDLVLILLCTIYAVKVRGWLESGVENGDGKEDDNKINNRRVLNSLMKMLNVNGDDDDVEKQEEEEEEEEINKVMIMMKLVVMMMMGVVMLMITRRRRNITVMVWL